MQQQSEVSDEVIDEGGWFRIYRAGKLIAEGATEADARRRLEPKPDAEAKDGYGPVCYFCGEPRGAHKETGRDNPILTCPSAQPKPDAAGEAKAPTDEECEALVRAACDATGDKRVYHYAGIAATAVARYVLSAPHNSALEDAIAALTARAEKAERERDEQFTQLLGFHRGDLMLVPIGSAGDLVAMNNRAEAAEAELAAVHKRLDAISEEDRMTRNANTNPSEGGDGYGNC